MPRQRQCRKCHDLFLPDPRSFRPTEDGRKGSPQHYCSKPECRRESKRCSHRTHTWKNPLYRQRQLLSARLWRKRNSDYWRQRRERYPAVAKRNRLLQRGRDVRAKGNLANINSIKALHIEKLRRIDVLIDLANINSIPVPWTLFAEEVVSFLKGLNHLANIKPIGKGRDLSAQSGS
jgi:hypothetical protein